VCSALSVEDLNGWKEDRPGFEYPQCCVFSGEVRDLGVVKMVGERGVKSEKGIYGGEGVNANSRIYSNMAKDEKRREQQQQEWKSKREKKRRRDWEKQQARGGDCCWRSLWWI
jgi:hypothetical protein